MNALIKIISTQCVDDERDVIELTTTGTLEKENDKYILCYNETEATGMEGTATRLDISPGYVQLTRTGTHPSMLILEENRRHLCNYQTPYGGIDLGTHMSELTYDLNDHGGRMKFSYTLGFNGGISSAHTVEITIQEEK